MQIDSFIALLYPHDPALWKTRMCPPGAAKASLLEGFKAPHPPYVTDEDIGQWKETFIKNGFKGAMCWYKIMTSGMQSHDDKG